MNTAKNLRKPAQLPEEQVHSPAAFYIFHVQAVHAVMSFMELADVDLRDVVQRVFGERMMMI